MTTEKHTPATLLALHAADPEGLNVIAAELMGETVVKPPLVPNKVPREAYLTSDAIKSYRRAYPNGIVRRLPRFSTSLDAVAELEAGLTDEEYARFQQWLWELAYQTVQKESHLRAYISAPAHLRLIAWVLTKQTI